VRSNGRVGFLCALRAFMTWKVHATGLSRAEGSTVGCTESVFYTEDCSHTILFPRRLPLLPNITGEQPVGVADSEVSSCCDMPRTLSPYKGVVMASTDDGRGA